MAHAKLSPSAASRWMACTPSAVLEQSFPNTTSEYAEEGTLAHSICELFLRYIFHQIKIEDHDEQYKKIQKSEYYSDQMVDYCNDYVQFVNEQCKGEFHLFIEQKLDMTKYIPEGFGTADAIVILPKERKIIFTDLKYGKGIKVDAKQNSQLKIYSLGVLETMEFIFGENSFDTIETNIYQPRIDNIASYTYTVKELIEWAENELKPAADKAFEGLGEYKAGKHCYWCRAKAKCRALADYNLELAKMDFANPDLLTDEEVLKVYEQKAIFENWLDAVSGYLLSTALEGKAWPGLKVVEGISRRKYKDENDVWLALHDKGYKQEQVYALPKLKGIGELEKLLTKPKFNEIVGPLCEKPQGKPALVPESDKRPTFSKNVENDFNVEI
jgi:hypothetical protein